MAFVPDRAGFLDLARQGRLGLRLPGGAGRHRHAGVGATPSWGADRTRSCSRAWSAASKWAAYSFAGVRPRAVVRARGERRSRSCARRRRELPRRGARDGGRAARASWTTTWPKLTPAVPPGLPRFFGGAVGWLGYDIVRSFERLPEHEARRPGSARALLRHHRHAWSSSTTCAARSRSWRRSTSATAPILGRAYDDACARIEAVLDELARPAPPLRPLDPDAGGGGRRAERDRDARGVRGGRAPHQGVHPGRRRVPGRLLAALPGAARRRRPVRRLPRAARDQPVAVHVPPRVSRGGGHRRVARGAGAARRRRDRGAARSPARARAARPPRRTPRWRPSCSPIRRSAPST